jgi:ligand-binding sensor domain-containing protein
VGNQTEYSEKHSMRLPEVLEFVGPRMWSTLLFFSTKMVKTTFIKSLSAFLFFLFFASRSVCTLDPNKQISQYAHSAWRMQDGAFSGAPNVITQTKDGYVWIGTLDGLVRFDGARFVSMATPGGQASLDGKINSLLTGRDGTLWVGTPWGLNRVRDGVITIRTGPRG